MEEQDLECNLLPPAGFDVHLPGYGDESEARKAGDFVSEMLKYLSAQFQFDLRRLDGLTMAYDYEAALENLDRGFEASRPLRASQGDVVGVGMTPVVVRDGQIRAHIVLHASTGEWLMGQDEERFGLALYTVGHEAAHVQDLGIRDDAIPGVIAKPLPVEIGPTILFSQADACWSEYAASRDSAFLRPKETESYDGTVARALAAAAERNDQAIRAYRLHRQVEQVLDEVASTCGDILKFASYLFGHLAGIDRAWQADAPDTALALSDNPEWQRIFSSLDEALNAMWATRRTWTGLEVYRSLTEVSREALRVAGLELRDLDAGALYVHIPIPSALSPDGAFPSGTDDLLNDNHGFAAHSNLIDNKICG